MPRIEDTSVHKAVHEALANCIVNTDFYLPRGIVILKEQDQIVMQNPGSIRAGKAQMLRGGISDPRNIAIMKMLNLISIGERAGSGVPDIYSVWADKGWTTPVVEEQYGPDRSILTLAFRKKQAEKTNQITRTAKTAENMNRIFAYILQNGSAGSSEIAAYLEFSAARVRVLLAELTAEGRIIPQGNGRSRRYCVTCKE